ncbi:MAG: hypothetical protein WD379_05630 [Dehalococcoidia bacterium]
MKITDVTGRRRHRMSPLKARVHRYLEDHPDEVFSYRDADIAKKLGVKISALSFTLWALHRENLIGRQEVDGKVYFGSNEAIRRLRERLGVAEPEDPFERARRIRDEIYRESGYIDSLELLDSVRGSWD